MSMSWQEGVAVTVVLLGLGAGAFLVAQRPSFWIEFGSGLGKALLPLAWRFVSKRMPPEVEAAWRAAERRGQGDEWLKERRQKQWKAD
ncbi:hypothetical protein [Aestuariivirga sp.]|uniref:hypothetical protein n=1 Tax=Aestuariivirga sp. TaxID=2650926 RepID=UPI0035ADD80A